MTETSKATRSTKRRRWLTAIALIIVLAILRPLIVDAMLWRGQTHLEARQHDSAITWLRIADWIDGDNAETHFLLARTYRRLEAFGEFEVQLKMAEDLGWNVKQLQREHLIALAQVGKYDQLNPHWADLFRDAGTDGPEISRAYVNGCLVHLRLSDARRVLEAWIGDYPDDPAPHFLNGQISEAVMLWNEAKEHYVACLKLDADHQQARMGLAKCQMAMGRFDLARTEIDKVLTASPESNEARALLAQCLEKLGETDAAVTLLREVLESDENHIDSLKTLGNLLLTQQRPEEALDYLKRAFELTPEDAAIRFPLAKAYKSTGNADAALPHFAFVDEATKPLILLGKLSGRVKQEPENTDLRYEIAMITWKYQSRSTGYRWFRSILDLDPNHKKTHLAIAEHFEVTGQSDLAKQHRKLAEQ